VAITSLAIDAWADTETLSEDTDPIAGDPVDADAAAIGTTTDRFGRGIARSRLDMQCTVVAAAGE
jgi:hypothetical protein